MFTILRVLGWFSTLSSKKKGPESPQIVYSSTAHNYRVLLGGFGSHFGAIRDEFESILKLIASY